MSVNFISDCYQCRSFDKLYQFRLCGEDDVKLKIFDISRNVIFKEAFSHEKLQELNAREVFDRDGAFAMLEALFRKKLLLPEYFPGEEIMLDEPNSIQFFKDEIKRFQSSTFSEDPNILTLPFQQAKDWQSYQMLPNLFLTTNDKDKAALAFLNLSLYQLIDNKISESMATLDKCRVLIPMLATLLLSRLYRLNKQDKEAFDLSVNTAKNLDPKEAGPLYKEALIVKPDRFDLYSLLSKSLDTPLEKVHVLLKGAHVALRLGSHEEATRLCEEARSHSNVCFSDQVIFLEILKTQKREPEILSRLLVLGDKSSCSSYWVLFSKDVIPNSRNKNYSDQKELVRNLASKTGINYELPFALETAVCILMHHVRTGERLYSDSPYTWTRCQETVQNYPVAVGGLSLAGLGVHYPHYDHDSFGVAVARKFF